MFVKNYSAQTSSFKYLPEGCFFVNFSNSTFGLFRKYGSCNNGGKRRGHCKTKTACNRVDNFCGNYVVVQNIVNRRALRHKSHQQRNAGSGICVGCL